MSKDKEKIMTTSDIRKTDRPTVLLICLIFVIALFIRIEYIENTSLAEPIHSDAEKYVSYGYNLAFHGTFSKDFPSNKPIPDSFCSPGYPFLISLALLAGHHLGGVEKYYPIMLRTQAVLSALLVPLTFLIGIRFLPLWASFVTTIFVAFGPHLISLTGYLLTETLFGFALLSAICCFYHTMRQNRYSWFAASGFFFGIAYLTNETALFVPFVFSLPLLLGMKKQPDKRLFMKICVFLFVFSLFPLAWGLRTQNLPANAPKASGRALASMSHGTYPDYIYKDPAFRYYPYHDDPLISEYSSSFGNFARILWSRFKERPMRHISWYLLEKPYYLWSWDILVGQGDVYVYQVKQSLYQISTTADLTRKLMKFLHPFMLILTLLGIPLLWREYGFGKRDEENHADTPLFVWIIIVYYTLIHIVFFSEPRYSIPFRPELYLVSMASFVVIIKKIGRVSHLFSNNDIPISDSKA